MSDTKKERLRYNGEIFLEIEKGKGTKTRGEIDTKEILGRKYARHVFRSERKQGKTLIGI